MSPTRWALLCGGDFYLNGSARGPGRTIRGLGGCVNDVLEVRKFLLSHGVKKENIKTLTSSYSDPTANQGPKEDAQCLPTWHNIQRELNSIKGNASRGDLVYFHFSGHGTRRAGSGPSISEHEIRGDPLLGMALVMTDVLTGGPYLTGYHLGVWVRSMVEQDGLRVTMVLDSCYSGGFFRNDRIEDASVDLQPRTILDWNDETWIQGDCDADEAANFLNCSPDVPSGMRDTKYVQKSWLSDPQGCSVLTACDLFQTAQEGTFGTSPSRHGLFTHWILHHLKGYTGKQLPSHRYIADHVNYGISSWGKSASQSPKLFGDAQHEFFGDNTYFEKGSVYVIGLQERSNQFFVTLDVGRVQGATVGARYTLIPGNSSFFPGRVSCGVRVEVTRVGELTSTAVITDQEKCTDVTAGWVAILTQWAFDPEIKVAIPHVAELDQDTLQKEVSYVPGLRLVDTQNEAEATYIIQMVTEKRTFEIYASGQRLPRLPSISLHEDRAIEKLVYVISHVARFRILQKRSLQMNSRLNRDLFFDIAPLETEDGDEITISLSYRGTLSAGVWASVYCFTASWGICRMEPLPWSGSPAHKLLNSLPPIGWRNEMVLTPSSCPDDPLQIQDQFVVFTSDGNDHAVSWDDICLPALPANKPLLGSLLDIQRVELPDGRCPGRRREIENPANCGALVRLVKTTSRTKN